jgi:hypothetical protein
MLVVALEHHDSAIDSDRLCAIAADFPQRLSKMLRAYPHFKYCTPFEISNTAGRTNHYDGTSDHTKQ